MIARGPAEAPADRPRVAGPTTRLHALLLCDLVDSTGLIERLGDGPAAELIRQHDRLARDCLQRHGGREIDKTDGFLLLFERPIQAVAFALDYTDALKTLAEASRQPLRARVGIHVGEVLLWRNDAADIADGAKPVEVEGLAKAIAARLMGLAHPGQILLSDTARMLAQRAAGELGSDRTATLRWLAHGRYRLKGVDTPLPVHEVGVRGVAPLRAPPTGDKARRLLPWWRRRWAQAAALLAVLVIPIVVLLKPQPAIAFHSRDWIVLASVRNLTDAEFGEAFDVALRIAIEQSRYVNAMPVSKVREVLGLMGAKPDSHIDRETAGEIALREGARAVLVPTIASVAGRLRISAELVDPVTSVTVYSRSADAPADEALAALDRVIRGVREDLGESLPSIENSSQPLARVTTPDLDALRAYSLATLAKGESRFGDARGLAEQAIALDPDFAMAHMLLGALELIDGDEAAAMTHFARASTSPQRLSNREALFLRAMLASMHTPARLDDWEALATLFPDHHSAHYNLSWFARHQRHDFPFAARAIEPALVRMNPRLANAHYLRGSALLADNRIEDALRAFNSAQEHGIGGDLREFAYAHAAFRDFPSAERIIRSQTDTGLSAQNEWHRVGELALAIDQGRWSQLPQLVDRPCPALASPALRCRALRATIAVLIGSPPAPPLSALLDDSAKLLQGSSELERVELLSLVTAVGWLAARAGHTADLARARDLLARHADGAAPEPFVHGLQKLLDAELRLLEGKPAQAADLLTAVNGGEPFALAATRARAMLAAERAEQAVSASRQLFERPGRAYAEVVDNPLLPINLFEMNAGLRLGARAAEQVGDPATAAQWHHELSQRWPELPALLMVKPED